MALKSNDYGLNYANYYTVNRSAGTTFAVKSGMGKLVGMFVSSAATTPLIKIIDGTSTSGTVLIDEYTPVSATMYNFGVPIIFENGLYLYSSSGTVVATVFYY